MSKVGEIRPSQLLWTFGPGALIDFPNISVVNLNIDLWQKSHCTKIQEARLLSAVQKHLGPTVQDLLVPPLDEDDDSVPPIGVPVQAFPRWMRCVSCGLLSPCDSGLFVLKEDRYRPERTRYVHKGCRGSNNDKPARNADAVPARFLLACRSGHLDDFPWIWFVHGGVSCTSPRLRFYENGSSLQTEDLWVRCDSCGASRNMAQAFGQAGARNLPACRGRHPHLATKEDDGCEQEPRAILLGASNGWFPVTLSVLAIPMTGNPLDQIIADNWPSLEGINDASLVQPVIGALRSAGQLAGIEKYTNDQIWAALENHRNGGSQPDQEDLKTPEWEVLTQENPPKDYPFFMSKKVSAPKQLEWAFENVLLLERLREVNALIGFTRVEAPDEGQEDEAAPKAPLSRNKPDFVPASEVHGEGIFIEFKKSALEAWEASLAVKSREETLISGHRGWRIRRNLDPDQKFPGMRHILLHTFAHVLIRELALQCGYNAASIRERIYAENNAEKDQSGVLIYTAAADSDGTLGGLVELGNPENLGPIISKALDRAKVCASDPLCSEHDPSKDQTLHGAACHACSLIAETSCEFGNRHLDRSLLVPTFHVTETAFFNES